MLRAETSDMSPDSMINSVILMHVWAAWIGVMRVVYPAGYIAVSMCNSEWGKTVN